MLPELNKKLPELRANIMKPFVFKTNPNYITVLALLVAFAAGYAFWKNMLLPAAALVLLNGFLDVLDGEIAKQFKRETKFGDFLDHVFDRIADVAILLGVTLNPNVPDLYGFGAIILVLLVSYLGTEAQALTKHRLYAAWLGRADRLLVLAIAPIVAIWFNQALYWAVLLILALSAVSFVQRFYIITQILRRK
jgi:phosphatidylglycerophosphate synthase